MDKKEMFKAIVAELNNQRTDEVKNKIYENLKGFYNIPIGVSISLLVRKHDEKFFESTDIRLITLFIIEAFKALGRTDQLNEYISIGEQNEAKQYDFNSHTKQNLIELPITFQPVVRVNDIYSTKASVKQLVGLVNAGVVNYNYDIQREAKLEIRTDKIIKKPTLNRANIREMKTLLLNDSLKESTLYLNAAPMTSVDGDELVYDADNYSLTITEGTRIDVLDGFHRLLACQEAFRENPMLDFEFNVVFSDFTTEEAIRWQAQHSKAAAWSKNRISELQQESKGAKVTKAIKDKDVEFERIISSAKRKNGEALISFNELSDFIDKHENIKTRRDEVEVAAKYATALLDIQDAKNSISTFKSQFIVQELLEKFTKTYNKDNKKFTEDLYKFTDYVNENNISLKLETETTNNMRTVAKQKIEEIFNKI